MGDSLNPGVKVPPEQEAIRSKCVHPSGTFVEFPREEIEQSIPDRFENIVQRFPRRIAVKTREQALTYDELNKASNRIAHAVLAKKGREAEPIVLLLDKGTTFLAAMLGVLKSGNICVPTEPSFPRKKIISVLENSQPRLILTSNQHVSMVSPIIPKGCSLMNLDEIGAGTPEDNPALSISPSALSFVSYTSGSTGSAKGVTRNHRNVLHNTMTNTNILGICAEDKWIALRPSGTAGVINDIFNILLNGGASYPIEPDKYGLASLAQWIEEEKITVFSSVVAVYRHFLRMVTGESALPSLRLLSLGGEPMLRSDMELYKKHFTDACVLVNRMGSSETGTVSYFFMDKRSEIPGRFVPVGYPAEDVTIILLNDEQREVPPDQTGEIAIVSHHLFSGYWRQEDLTSRKFVYPQGRREHVYLTGDLGRVSQNGCLEFLGRKDLRVKVRGHRIEIAEVEMALLAVESVEDAVVVVEEVCGSNRLVAYIVPAGSSEPSVEELRNSLSQSLPEYMIPSVFEFFRAFPLMPTGKVDRHALPRPKRSRPSLNIPYLTPRSPVEVELERIWAEVLSLDHVGIHDNFFYLGGHSLIAFQLISRVIQAFQLELPVRALLDTPTVAEMAVVIAQNQAKAASEAQLSQMLREVEAMTEEETQRHLASFTERQLQERDGVIELD